MNLEKQMKNIFKMIIKGIMISKGVNPSKLTDEHFEALWKISEETPNESEKSDKLQQYLKTYVL